jgi:hypothetical protein
MTKIEVVHGPAELILSKHAGGSATMLSINRQICRYWGNDLPFADVDKLIAAGYRGSSGVFIIEAIAIPHLGRFFSNRYQERLAFGSAFMLIGTSVPVTAGLFVLQDFDKWPILAFALAWSSLFSGIGWIHFRYGMIIHCSHKLVKACLNDGWSIWANKS